MRLPFALVPALLIAALVAGHVGSAPPRTRTADDEKATPSQVAPPVARQAATTAATPAEPAPEHGRSTKIAAQVPAQYRTPFLPGHTPVEILTDGTQIYDDIPYKVRQIDGSMKEFHCRMSIQPTAVLPVLPSELAAVR